MVAGYYALLGQNTINKVAAFSYIVDSVAFLTYFRM